MERIVDQISRVIDNTINDFEGDTNYNDLKEASDNYNELARLGIIKKKGYSLLSIDRTNIKQPTFNSCFQLLEPPVSFSLE
jgi:hypothetical protein